MKPRYKLTGTTWHPVFGEPVRSCIGSLDGSYFWRVGSCWYELVRL